LECLAWDRCIHKSESEKEEERSAADNMVGGLEVGSDAASSEDSSEEEEDKSERDQISPYIHPRGKLKGGEYCASVRDVQWETCENCMSSCRNFGN